MKRLLNHSKNLNLVFGIILLLVFGAIISSISDFIISREGDKQITNIRLNIQKHLLLMPLDFFDDNVSGQLSSRVINDATVVKNFMASSIPSFINNGITIIGTLGILFFLDWKMTCLVLLAFPLFSIIAIPIGHISKNISLEYQTQLSKLNGVTTESLQNMRSIKLNVTERNVFRKFETTINALYQLSIKADVINAIVSPFQLLLSYGVVIAIIIYGGIRVSLGSLTIGTLVSILIYFFQLMPALQVLANFYSSYKRAVGSTEKITEIINVPVEKSSGTFVSKNEQSNYLQLKNASFSYKNKPIIKNLNIVFPKNSKIAIVGPSGAGKTTIINILTQLYTLDSGKLMLGSVDANNYSLSSWRDLFSVVTQENSITSGTIKDNLIFALNRDVSDIELEKSLKAADLWDNVQILPKKMDTLVGENGVKLSGGQRQRLQIARSYLKKVPFIIFDEATSNLDADSEKTVTSVMNKLSKERTVIVIAHRLSTIVDSDCIYFLDKGEIQDNGTHKELLNHLPAYRKFVNEQMLTK